MGNVPLVLIGGTLCDARLWAPMLAGWRTDAITLTVGEPFGAGPRTMRAYASEVLQRLPPRASLVGFSLGGLVALELVAQAPGRFDRLALVCAGAGPETPDGEVARRAGEATALAKGMEAHLREDLLPLYVLRKEDDTTGDTLIDMARTLGLDTYRRQNDLAITRADSRPRLGAINMPVLLVSGEHDRLCPPSRHRDMAGALPNVRRRIVPGCGHVIPLDGPAMLRDLIANLLAD